MDISYILMQPDDMIREQCKLLDNFDLHRLVRSNRRLYQLCGRILADRKAEYERKKREFREQLWNTVDNGNRFGVLRKKNTTGNTVMIDRFGLDKYSITDPIRKNLFKDILQNGIQISRFTNYYTDLTEDQKTVIADILFDNEYEIR